MLHVDGLTVRYGAHTAVDGLSLHADHGEILCVVGPSGCGKSTLLRAIAGLVVPDAGRIHLGGEPLDGLRPDQRRVGLMFQDHALFPHRDVADNVAFGPRMQRLNRTEIRTRVHDALELVDLGGTDRRPITSLSGGEQQRVALARAIASQPRLLMLDEPLGSLDRALRDRLLTDLPPVLRALGTTVIYVTHDQDEALALADRIAVMDAGRIAQVGSPDDVWQRPANEFVAGFIGLAPILDARIRVGTATTVLGAVPTPDLPDGEARIVLLMHALRLADDRHPVGDDDLPITGRVVGRRFAGDHVNLRVHTESGVEVTVPIWRDVGPEAGASVTIALDPDAIHVVGCVRQ